MREFIVFQILVPEFYPQSIALFAFYVGAFAATFEDS
jgi:hypothetical protein